MRIVLVNVGFLPMRGRAEAHTALWHNADGRLSADNMGTQVHLLDWSGEELVCGQAGDAEDRVPQRLSASMSR